MASVKIVRAKYRKFPTHFELQNVKLTIAEVDSIIGKLEREKEAPATVEEFESDVRSLNFLAYLHLRQLQPDKAKPLVEGTLQKEPRNVTALANKCELHLQYFEITEAEAALRTLERVSENKESIAIALSELAYSLSRCGPCSHLSAATKFAEAIEVGQSRCLPEKLVAWHYGMALSYNRSLALEHILENPGVDVEENFKMAIAALAYVAKSDHKFLKAKAYVILGEITKHYWRDVKRVQGNMSHVIVKLPEESLTVFECFERAYELAPEDHWVLGRFGRHLRHVKQHERALEMLNRACDLCPSAFTRHHQGLVYRSMAYEANKTANAGRGRSHRGHPRSRGYQQRRDSEGRGAHGGFTADICESFSAIRLENKDQRPAHGEQSIVSDIFSVPCRGRRMGRYHCSKTPGRLQYYAGTRSDNEQRRGRGNTVALQDYQGWNKSGHDGRSYQRQDQVLSNRNTSAGYPSYRPLPERPIFTHASSGYKNVTDPRAKDNMDLAIECIKKGIELSNETAHSLLGTLAEIYSSLGKHEEADECFRKSLQEDQYVTHLSRARTLEVWGLAMKKRGMLEKSHNYFRMAIEYAAKVKITQRVAFQLFMHQLKACRDPTHKDLLYQSTFFELVGRHGDALKLLYEAHSMKQDPEVQYSIIKNLAAEKEYQKALTSCVMLQCTDSADIIDDRDLVDISFGAVKQRMADLSLQNSQVLRNIYDRLLRNSCKEHEVFIFHNEDDKSAALAENVQELAKEMAQIECVPLCCVPGGQILVQSIAEVPESYDAIIVMVTPEFVRNDAAKKLCLYLLQGSCVLLCLCAPCVSENDIPKALKAAHRAILPQGLCGEAFKDIDPLQKLDVWRNIFDNLWAAKNAA
ncbi:uncharacterized protein LOC133349767 isoform X1 [Lethenteron reissneri]|uniref:uncharacterized protein LOC133349767 isoform X1 n=3 Tax=Lethenteron reissneri TaxID=7753 RepID=UPI002AB5F070|nr:uncharacterized protein LOC133349767 isoform X1 [Lethenteron reissneri]